MKEQNSIGLVQVSIRRKRGAFYLHTSRPILNPDSNCMIKWHHLCEISEGEIKAKQLAKRIEAFNRVDITQGDMPRYLMDWIARELEKRRKHAPQDPMKLRMFRSRNKEMLRLVNVISETFHEFNVTDVRPADVAMFVDQWEGQRTAEIYKSTLSKFFAWCCRNGLMQHNPAREVSVQKTKPRDVYISNEQFHQIRAALTVGKDGKPTASGVIVQCYVDLCYLLYQRTTEIRLLKWGQITEEGIFFQPTKTESSSSLKVIIPMTTAIRAVLDRAAEFSRSYEYVICSKKGEPYTASGLGSAWTRACERAGFKNLTLKDLRAKAMTDARMQGYEMKQISVGAAHTDEAMTETYIRRRITPKSEVILDLPPTK